jgi:hypothetical protein
MSETAYKNMNDKFIYQLIYSKDMNHKNPYERSPTLETVLMVEKTINRHSGEFNRTQLWKKLPKKVMWQTYLVILDYLQANHKIAVDRVGKIGYIWNPRLVAKLMKRKDLFWKK